MGLIHVNLRGHSRRCARCCMRHTTSLAPQPRTAALLHKPAANALNAPAFAAAARGINRARARRARRRRRRHARRAAASRARAGCAPRGARGRCIGAMRAAACDRGRADVLQLLPWLARAAARVCTRERGGCAHRRRAGRHARGGVHLPGRGAGPRAAGRGACTQTAQPARLRALHPQQPPADRALPANNRAQAAALGLKAPTEIQAQVIPEIIKGGHVVMASHTGSGKTLAYLLPVVRRARRHARKAPPAAAWARVR
jgi:hypothetical protein